MADEAQPSPGDGGQPVFLHIGLPKTGTSYLQSALSRSRERLAAEGVLVPGDRRNAHTLEVWDLFGRRPRGAEQDVSGAWDAMVAAVSAWTGSHAVISSELLSSANDRQVRRTVHSFGSAEVHVVVTVRDLARVVPATWQQELTKGRLWSWADYVAAVRDPESGPATAGLAFWLRQDLVRVLDAWEAVVPRERIHLVTVPPAGSPPDLLLARFAEAVRIDPDWLDVEVSPSTGNTSVGLVEAEVLRQLNLGLGGRLNERQYTRVVQYAVKPALQQQPNDTPIALSADDRKWVEERSGELVATLRTRGHHVLGDLDDLIPPVSRGVDTSGPASPDIPPEQLATAALAALVSIAEAYGTFWWRARRADPASGAAARSRVSSWLRSVAFRSRAEALDRADRSRLLHRAALLYTRRSRARTRKPRTPRPG
jgi:hypothetical protein